MYINIYVNVYVYIYIAMHVYVYIYVCVCIYVHVDIHVPNTYSTYTYINVYTCTYTCLHKHQSWQICTYLIHIAFDPSFWQVLSPPTNEFVDIHIHQFEHQRQAASGLFIQDFYQFDDSRVWRQPPQRLFVYMYTYIYQYVYVY